MSKKIDVAALSPVKRSEGKLTAARSPIRRIGAPSSSRESNAPRTASNQGSFYFGNPSEAALT